MRSLLASSCLSLDEDARVGPGDHFNLFQCLVQRGTVSNDLAEGEFCPYCLAEVRVFHLQLPAERYAPSFAVVTRDRSVSRSSGRRSSWELGRPVEYVNLPISDWGRVLIESVGLPEFLVAHLKAVAEDHQDGVFSAQTDVVQRIGGQAA